MTTALRRAVAIAFGALAACGGTERHGQEALIVTPAAAPAPCPPGSLYNGAGCATPLTDLAPDSGPGVAPEVAGPAVSDAGDRDPRAGARTARGSALVAVEVRALERLVGATAANDADHPKLLRRLGDVRFELSYAQAAAGELGRAAEARRGAILAYGTFLRDHPGAPDTDDVLYFEGYAYELLGDFASARKTYYQLIQRMPSSRWIGHAYYAFGVLFAKEARLDVSMADLALQAYVEVLNFPNNAMRPWAMLGIGEVNALRGHDAPARSMFERLRQEFPGHPATVRIP